MKKAIYIIAAISVGIVIGFFAQPMISGDNIFEQMKKFQFVLNTVTKNYVDEVDSQKIIEAAISGMLAELDPHSTYITKDEMKKVTEDFKGHYDGIGVEFDIINDTITVIAPLSGGPSELLGILSGDKIVKIDNKDAVGISREEVPKRLKGPKGTIVEVDIKRENDKELIHFTIKRDVIPNYSLEAFYMIDKTDVGYVILTRFAETTYDEMMSAVNNLKQQGMKRLILDLRGNPGGYLTQAYKIADEFLPGGNMIVYTKGRRPEFDESYTSSDGGQLENIPLIVLINAGSASASEIVSGAIQDLDRGLVVGTTSFGKGLVQRQYELEDGAAFRLTISRYYTPSGRSIQRPYKDKDVAAYRSLVGRLELEEGANVEHSFEKLKNDEKKKDAKDKDKINFDSIKTYKSKAGRMMLGGGGITPDYIVKGDTSHLTKMVSKVGYSVYNEIATDFLHTDEGLKFKEKYKNNFIDFLRNYDVPKSVYSLYKEVLKAKKIDWVQEDFDKDKDFIDMFIKRRIARIIWDRNKDAQVFSTIDRQLTKAVALFPESEKVRKMK